MASNVEVAQVLNNAADKIEAQGWWSGVPQLNKVPANQGGPICAGLALDTPHDYDYHLQDEASEFFCRFLGLVFLGDTTTLRAIYNWNDLQLNGEVVIAKLREAAQAALNPTKTDKVV